MQTKGEQYGNTEALQALVPHPDLQNNKKETSFLLETMSKHSSDITAAHRAHEQKITPKPNHSLLSVMGLLQPVLLHTTTWQNPSYRHSRPILNKTIPQHHSPFHQELSCSEELIFPTVLHSPCDTVM